MLLSQRHDLTHGHQPAVQMRDEEGARCRPERRSQIFRSKVPLIGIDINKDGTSADGGTVEEIAFIVVSGHDYFIARPDFQCSQRQVDCERAATAGEDMLDLVHGGQTLLQPRDLSAVIATPRTVAIRRLHRGEDGFISDWPGGRTLWPHCFTAQNYRQAVVRCHIPGPFPLNERALFKLSSYHGIVRKGPCSTVFCHNREKYCEFFAIGIDVDRSPSSFPHPSHGNGACRGWTSQRRR